LPIDSKSDRVHQEGEMYIKKSKIEQKIGRSRCGFTTKIHTTVDKNGVLIRIFTFRRKCSQYQNWQAN
jgi:hypothetical protein